MGDKDKSGAAEHALRVIICFSFDHRAPVDELRAFKRALIDSPHVLHSIELSGTFDFIVEMGVTGLEAYHEKIDALAGDLQKLVLRYETSFVCKRFAKKPAQTGSPQTVEEIWVPSEQGMRRIDMADITMVTAERDYVRIHVAGGATYLLHSTIGGITDKLNPDLFVRIHRSTILRRDLIEQLLHEKRRWTARLVDGSVHRISKGHASQVLQSSTRRNSADDSSNRGTVSSPG
ncbi:MAG TPA: LytTR family transcriptional regulator DNA-binding domain-containing protein [Allosphingosinicella sp.]